MSMTPQNGGRDNDLAGVTEAESLAMDYALGGLGRAERKAAEVRLASDAAFREAVARWQALLGPLDEATAPVTPPAALWQAIAADVQPARQTSKSAAAPAVRSAGWWHNLALWRAVGIGGPVLAAITVALLAMPPETMVAPAAINAGPALVATLADAQGRPLLAAAYDPATSAVRFAPVAQGGADQAGPNQVKKVPELWVIEGQAAPKSLGVIDISAGSSHAIPRERLAGLKPGSILAISIEPVGGSRTGAPTGPIIATGALSAA
jgi:anti-sigma-K factor RskA